MNAAPLAPLPSWILELASKPDLRVVEGEVQSAPHAEIRYRLPERIYKDTRNTELCRYAESLRAHGWEPPDILSELRRVNRERCVPPLPDDELEKIALQSGGWDKGNASAAAPEVRQALVWLAQKAQQRFRSGLGAYSRWAVYRALLNCAWSHGWMLGNRAVAVRISIRELRRAAGLGSKGTLHSALKNWLRGRYWPVDNWQHVLDRVRTMSGEKLAENLAQQQDEPEREAYRFHLTQKEAGDQTGGQDGGDQIEDQITYQKDDVADHPLQP